MENEVKKSKKKNQIIFLSMASIMIIIIIILVSCYFIAKNKESTDKKTDPVIGREIKKYSATLQERFDQVQIGNSEEQVKEIFVTMDLETISESDNKLVQIFRIGEASSPGYYEIIFVNGIVAEKQYQEDK